MFSDIWFSSVAFLFWKAGIHHSGKGQGGKTHTCLNRCVCLHRYFALRSAFSLPSIPVWDFTLWSVT